MQNDTKTGKESFHPKKSHALFFFFSFSLSFSLSFS